MSPDMSSLQLCGSNKHARSDHAPYITIAKVPIHIVASRNTG